MRILVLGASQGTGARCVEAALAKGHEVTAFARTPSKLEIADPGLTKVAGDFHDGASVRRAVAGHDAVIICVSARNLLTYVRRPDYFSRGTRSCIAAMRDLGVGRLVVLSAFGAGDSFRAAPWSWRRFIIRGVLRIPYADHDVQERMVRESGLDFVIARPTRLTDGPPTGTSTRTTGFEVPLSIARADVAEFLVEGCDADEFVGRSVQLGG